MYIYAKSMLRKINKRQMRIPFMPLTIPVGLFHHTNIFNKFALDNSFTVDYVPQL